MKKLNPEIRQQAAKLFVLIEEQIEKTSPDKTSEAIRDELGEFLKSSEGFKELTFGYRLSKTQSERATNSLEESTWYMDNKALSDLCELAMCAGEITDLMDEDEINTRRVSHILKRLRKVAPGILKLAVYEWESRAKSYKDELDELKSN